VEVELHACLPRGWKEVCCQLHVPVGLAIEHGAECGQLYLQFCRYHPVTYLVNYLLTPRSSVLLEKLTCFQLVKKFSAIYGTRRFITAFTKCPPPVHVQSQINPVHTATSHFLKIPLNIILPSMPGSPKWSLSLRFPTPKPRIRLSYAC